MPLRFIYVTIGWIPGKVLFANKVKKVVGNDKRSEEGVAHDFLKEKATILKEKTMSTKPVSEIMSEMYFEIYDSQDAETPTSATSNAPSKNI